MWKIKNKFNYVDFMKILKQDHVAMESFERLARARRNMPNLVALIGNWCCSGEIFEQRKKELDRLKERLDRLVTVSKALADEIDGLSQERLEIFARHSIGEVLSGGVLGDGKNWIIPPSRQPLDGLSDQLREKSAALGEVREAWGKEYSVRTLTPASALAQIYFYCCEVTPAKSISYRDLANVLAKAAAVHGIPEPTEDLLRKNVRGFQERPEVAEVCALMQDQIRYYLKSVPAGIPTFTDWMASRKPRNERS